MPGVRSGWGRGTGRARALGAAPRPAGGRAQFTIVRPGFLTNDRKTTPYRVFTRLGELRTGAVSRAQVAQFIVAALEQDLYPRETVLLTC